MNADEEEVVPPQYVPFRPPPGDFRNVVLQVGGGRLRPFMGNIQSHNADEHTSKRKRDDEDDEDGMEEEMERGAEETDGQIMVGKRRLYANTDNLGKKSGRDWKPATKRSSSHVVRNDKQKKVDWDQKMQTKTAAKLVRDRIKLIKKTELDKVKAEKIRREEVKLKKEENRRNSSIVQKITNKKTLKAMSKKAQKGVRFVKEVAPTAPSVKANAASAKADAASAKKTSTRRSSAK
jgi:hypothetical protein